MADELVLTPEEARLAIEALANLVLEEYGKEPLQDIAQIHGNGIFNSPFTLAEPHFAALAKVDAWILSTSDA